ncbi:MAG: peptide chain release factor 2 [Candidatus Electronema sp. V4]|uniref:peptide chain release factor 2 n=1 Tax=Candidatus Electronema sp. V4 TaxID=3454756 RepID=UPI00405565E9
MAELTETAELRQKIQALKDKMLALKEHLDLDSKKLDIERLESDSLEPNFWNDQHNAKKVQRQLGQLQDVVGGWELHYRHVEEAELLLDMALEEGDAEALNEVEASLGRLAEEVEATELECMFVGEHDSCNAMLTVHAGAGGTEAQDWVSMLLRMYLRWAELHSFKADILDYLPGDEAGVKSVTVLISGKNAYGYTRSEVGIHRLVRISPFDASGRRHTSFASVMVLPELDDTIEIDINEKDLRIDTYRSSGAGGQHVNKTDSAIRITHLPTNIVVQCQNERSQLRNKEMAMKMLMAKLYDKQQQENLQAQENLHGEKKEIAWGSQIRSYVLQPYRLIKDHRTGVEVGNVDAALDGELDQFIKAFLLWQPR